ncbi:MAG: D-hexose-6-phosphate mutarotase [Gammaproteobacteria bacterium]
MSEAAFGVLALSTADGASARVCRHGAQVLGWCPRGAERDLLYLSPRSVYADGAAIRGGIPVVFPQFGGFGPLPKHGFARTRAWRLVDRAGTDRIAFECSDDAMTRACWPHAFRARLEVALDADSLATALTVTNTGDATLSFTAALHTYLAVRNIAQACVHGLAGARYLDATQSLREDVEERDAVTFDGEFDRVYPATAHELVLEDAGERITVEREGFADAVVWNPGAEKAAALPDLGDGDWRRFLCIEPAVFAPPVTLAAGARWRGVQRLRHSVFLTKPDALFNLYS